VHLVDVAVGVAAAGGNEGGGGGLRPRADRRMVLCILAVKPPMMLAPIALGLWVGPQSPHVELVWALSTSLPWV
jgi:hypothetical protein